MDQKLVLVDREGGVVTLTLNRPERRNALSPELLYRLAEVFDLLQNDPEVRVVVVRGAGEEAFSAGYEIGRIGESPSGPESTPGESPSPFEHAMQRVAACPHPTIAMVSGYAVGGGCELAVTCDLRIAAENARLGITPAKLGIVYSPRGLHKFVHLIGPSRTRLLFYTGRIIDAASALQMGLVDQVVPIAQLSEVTYRLAGEIASNAPLSLRGTNLAVRYLTSYRGLPAQEEQEMAELRRRAQKSEDLREGQRAFAERRKPSFTGR